MADTFDENRKQKAAEYRKEFPSYETKVEKQKAADEHIKGLNGRQAKDELINNWAAQNEAYKKDAPGTHDNVNVEGSVNNKINVDIKNSAGKTGGNTSGVNLSIDKALSTLQETYDNFTKKHGKRNTTEEVNLLGTVVDRFIANIDRRKDVTDEQRADLKTRINNKYIELMKKVQGEGKPTEIKKEVKIKDKEANKKGIEKVSVVHSETPEGFTEGNADIIYDTRKVDTGDTGDTKQQKANTYKQQAEQIRANHNLGQGFYNTLNTATNKKNEAQAGIAEAKQNYKSGRIANRGRKTQASQDFYDQYMYNLENNPFAESIREIDKWVNPITAKQYSNEELLSGKVPNYENVPDEVATLIEPIEQKYNDDIRDYEAKHGKLTPAKRQELFPRRPVLSDISTAKSNYFNGLGIPTINMLGVNKFATNTFSKLISGKDDLYPEEQHLAEILENIKEVSNNGGYDTLSPKQKQFLLTYDVMEELANSKAGIEDAEGAYKDAKAEFKGLNRVNTENERELAKELASNSKKALGRRADINRQDDGTYHIGIRGKDEGISGTGKQANYVVEVQDVGNVRQGRLGNDRMYKVYSAIKDKATGKFISNRGSRAPVAYASEAEINEAGGLDNWLKNVGDNLASNLDQVEGKNIKGTRGVMADDYKKILDNLGKSLTDIAKETSSDFNELAKTYEGTGIGIVADKDADGNLTGSYSLKATPEFVADLLSGSYIDEKMDGPGFLKQYKDAIIANMIKPGDVVLNTAAADKHEINLKDFRTKNREDAIVLMDNAEREAEDIRKRREKVALLAEQLEKPTELKDSDKVRERLDAAREGLQKALNNRHYDILDRDPETGKITKLMVYDSKEIQGTGNKRGISGKFGNQVEKLQKEKGEDDKPTGNLVWTRLNPTYSGKDILDPSKDTKRLQDPKKAKGLFAEFALSVMRDLVDPFKGESDYESRKAKEKEGFVKEVAHNLFEWRKQKDAPDWIKNMPDILIKALPKEAWEEAGTLTAGGNKKNQKPNNSAYSGKAASSLRNKARKNIKKVNDKVSDARMKNIVGIIGQGFNPGR